jgi:hypothetical protein
MEPVLIVLIVVSVLAVAGVIIASIALAQSSDDSPAPPPVPPAPPTLVDPVWYLSSSGSDAGDGSELTPWLTMAHAFARMNEVDWEGAGMLRILSSTFVLAAGDTVFILEPRPRVRTLTIAGKESVLGTVTPNGAPTVAATADQFRSQKLFDNLATDVYAKAYARDAEGAKVMIRSNTVGPGSVLNYVANRGLDDDGDYTIFAPGTTLTWSGAVVFEIHDCRVEMCNCVFSAVAGANTMATRVKTHNALFSWTENHIQVIGFRAFEMDVPQIGVWNDLRSGIALRSGPYLELDGVGENFLNGGVLFGREGHKDFGMRDTWVKNVGTSIVGIDPLEVHTLTVTGTLFQGYLRVLLKRFSDDAIMTGVRFECSGWLNSAIPPLQLSRDGTLIGLKAYIEGCTGAAIGVGRTSSLSLQWAQIVNCGSAVILNGGTVYSLFASTASGGLMGSTTAHSIDARTGGRFFGNTLNLVPTDASPYLLGAAGARTKVEVQASNGSNDYAEPSITANVSQGCQIVVLD